MCDGTNESFNLMISTLPSHLSLQKSLSFLQVHPQMSSASFLNFVLPSILVIRDFSFQNIFEHFAIRFRQPYLMWEV